MHTRAIVNPTSCNGRTGRVWSRIKGRVEDRIGEVDVSTTERGGHATEIARTALRDGAEEILVVGGDGTVNEVVNGFFDDGQAINPDAVLTMVMAGSGGDFKRTFGVAEDVQHAIDRIAEAEPRRIDLGRVEFDDNEGRRATRFFDNVASMGISGDVVHGMRSARYSRLLGGAFAYRWASLTSMLRWSNQRARLEIDDDFDEDFDLSLVAVCNGQYFGGGMWIAPEAVPDDGMFDVTIIRDLTFWDFIRSSAAFYKGEHLRSPKAQSVRGRRVTVRPTESGAKILLEIDGEALGRLPATLEVVPGALRLKC